MGTSARKIEIAVIGGGASGMMAALAASGPNTRVTVYERQARVGRKLAATGNGRCNLTNLHASPEHYHGEQKGFSAFVLSREGVERSLERFRDLGLLTVRESDGRVYPMSDNAGSVVDVLRFSLDAFGAHVRCGCPVKNLKKRDGSFQIQTEEGNASADRVIVACGGRAGGKLGGVEDGYTLLQGFGHSCTELRPALVQLRTKGILTRGLKGIRARADVRVMRGNRITAAERGEVQFTEYGLSGPAVFAVSREATRGDGAVVTLDLFPELTREELTAVLLRRIQTRPDLTLDDVFTGTVQNRLGRMLVRSLELNGAVPLKDAAGSAELLAARGKDFSFRVLGSLGFDQAQVTAGGIRTTEFDPQSLESRLCSGLYACGEVLDVDGDCGGYNLQWAWSSGWTAGISAAGGSTQC